MNVQSPIGTLAPLAPLAPPPPRERGRGRLRHVLVALAMLALGLLGWRYAFPHVVPAEPLRPGPLVVELKGPGTLTALFEATVSSRIQARIEQLPVDRNDVVARGDVLARLAFGDLAGEVAAAEASAEASERAIRAAEADRGRAAASLDKAQAAHDRQQSLFGRGVTSQAGLDDTRAALRQAEAELTHADRSVERAEAESAAARARVAVARTQLADAVLTAPIGGVVVSRAHNLGDMLTPGEELLRIVDPAGIVLTARLDESVIDLVRPGQAARMTFGRSAAPVSGRVLRLGRQVDEETREFEVDIALDRLPENWALGQRGIARIAVERREDALTVPHAFLVRRNGKPGVWVLEGGRARWRAVTLGARGADRVEIVRGPAAGAVILEPAGLYPRARVRPAEARP